MSLINFYFVFYYLTQKDISSIVKRTSSILMKDKDSSRILKPRSSTLQHESKGMLPTSPLAAIEPCQNAVNSSSGFLHPSVLFRNKQPKQQKYITFIQFFYFKSEFFFKLWSFLKIKVTKMSTRMQNQLVNQRKIFSFNKKISLSTKY